MEAFFRTSHNSYFAGATHDGPSQCCYAVSHSCSLIRLLLDVTRLLRSFLRFEQSNFFFVTFFKKNPLRKIRQNTRFL